MPDEPAAASPPVTAPEELQAQRARRRVAEAVAADVSVDDVVALALRELGALPGVTGAAVVRPDGPAPAAAGAEVVAAIPGDDDPWGALRVTTAGPPGAGLRHHVARTAGLVGLAVAAARRRTALDRRIAEHDALRRVAMAVAADEGRDHVLALASEEAARLIGTGAGFVATFTDGSARIAGGWIDDRFRSLHEEPLTRYPLSDDGVLARVHRTGRAALVEDYRLLDGEVAAHMTRRGIVGSAAAPITVAGRLWGGIVVVTRDEGGLGPEAAQQLAAFAELLEMAIAATETRDLLVTDTVAAIFSSPTSPDATLQRIAESAREALGGDRATCYVHDDLGGVVLRYVTTETDPERLRAIAWAVGRGPGDMPMWQMARENPDPLSVFPDLDRHHGLPRGFGARVGSRSALMFRMEGPARGADGRSAFVGSLTVTYRERRRFTERDLAMARTFGGLAGLAVAQARLHHETLQSLAAAEERTTLDPLTGLANHRAFQDRLAAEVERARRHGRSLSLALVDIDDFRELNRRLGHEAGDRVLSGIAQRLSLIARPEDVVARVGGEEFAWLLPECAALDAWQICERAREMIARTRIAEASRVTVSIGVCDLAHATDAGQMLKLAEGALYWAKEHGRNATFRYTPEVVHVLSAQERAEALQRDQALVSVRLLARVVDAKDPATREHSERVASLGVLLAAQLGWDEARRDALHEAALVHDVGKIAVRDAVLFKPGRLTAAEYAEVTQHALIGAKMIEEVLTPEQIAWVRGHHERVDGGGYPDGLVGDLIPDGARILAVADAVDVMTNARVYSPPMPLADAVAEARHMAGQQFDRDVVDALEELWARGALLQWDAGRADDPRRTRGA